MASKRLTPADIEHMKSMVSQGIAPEDIAKHFSIAISSVHNYKNRFKAEGMQFPNVRGKRPTGSVQVQSLTPQAEVSKPTFTDVSSKYNFVVNGMSVQVSGDAKNVNITKDGIEVKF